MRKDSPSIRKISRISLNESPSAVAKTIRHYDETGSSVARPRNGRRRATSATQMIRLLVLPAADLQHLRLRLQILYINASRSGRHTVFQQPLFRGNGGSQAFMVELRQISYYLGRATSRRTLLGPRNTRNGH